MMLDVVVQTGSFPPQAVDAGDFQVESQKRAWVHLAMDRFTGRIVDWQMEPVEE